MDWLRTLPGIIPVLQPMLRAERLHWEAVSEVAQKPDAAGTLQMTKFAYSMGSPPVPEKSPFVPGKKYPLVGVSLQISSPLIRWGLPVANGLVVGFIVWLSDGSMSLI